MGKDKCKCGHARDVHGGQNGRNDYAGPCCVQYYRRSDGKLVCCQCNKFDGGNK